MLTSFPSLDSAFSNPAASCPTLSETSSVEKGRVLLLPTIIELPVGSSLLGGPFKNIDFAAIKSPPCKKLQKQQVAKQAMNNIEPEDDLKQLIENEAKLRLCGYYYGNLSWVDASHILKRSKVGTFLVRDSEHCSYLYALSVQTKRGPTSCRIDYDNGRFRLDSSGELSEKMPRFNSVTDLVDHYVHLTKNLPRKPSPKDMSPVWLDMDEENTRDVPVQIYKPLYKNVRSLQHMCRVNLIKFQREGQPSVTLNRTNAFDVLPTMLQNYLKEYPYPQ